MDDVVMRFVGDLLGRVDGPMRMRLVLQPAIAVLLGVIAARKDARQGWAPYFFGLLTDPVHRRARLAEGWKSIGKVFIAALVLDMAYQWVVRHFVFPGEAVLVACLLAIVPYVIVRSGARRFLFRK